MLGRVSVLLFLLLSTFDPQFKALLQTDSDAEPSFRLVRTFGQLINENSRIGISNITSSKVPPGKIIKSFIEALDATFFVMNGNIEPIIFTLSNTDFEQLEYLPH